MIRTFVLLAAAIFINTALAQDDADEYAVVLPEDAQKCVLPAAPDAIPENATLEQLKKAKADIAVFQGQVGEFRECLDAAQDNPSNTEGNKQAIISSFNYSVEMEERIAARFNEAIRDYKERNAN